MIISSPDLYCVTIVGDSGVVCLIYHKDMSGAPIILWRGRRRREGKVHEMAMTMGFPTLIDETLVRDLIKLSGEIPKQHFRRIAKHLALVHHRDRHNEETGI